MIVKMKKKNIIVRGCDLSLNHGAIVELKNGKFNDFWFYTDKSCSAKTHENGMHIKLSSNKQQPDKQLKSVFRLNLINDFLSKIICDRHSVDFYGIEDYAFSASQGAHQIGEVGGAVRIKLWIVRIPFRLHDPLSIKMFVTHDGTAKKDLVEECVKNRWGLDFSKYNGPNNKNRQTSEDLSDAFGIAKMVWTEYLLRTGKLELSSLHEKEIQVFNRITKTYPVNILGREWIKNNG